ncbi:glycosyltransferase family 2 protein [Flavobacterium sp. LB2P44]|uniref:glycosyltransferase family 2 protein n=1 Tax=Flavobacterium sp. LB2P44 TaxID=3401713 RepID=UPI003AAC7C2C
MNLKKVSIIVPCYKQAQYLDEALLSVLDQTYNNWECLIVNDGSPDGTLEVAKKWVAKDNRFRYFYQENGGLSSARNFGISNALGEFILPLDADDKIAPHYVSLAIESFQVNEFLKVVYCKGEKFGVEQGLWLLPDFSRTILVKGNMIFCCAMYRKSDWIKVGGYDKKLIYGLEDWEFWIAILKIGGEVRCLDYLGFYYRTKTESMIGSLNTSQRIFSENYVQTKHLDFVLANYDAVVEANNNLIKQKRKLEVDFKSEKILLNALFYKVFKIKVFTIKQ